MSMHLIELRSDVLVRFTAFYLYTLTFVVLHCLVVLFSVEFECPTRPVFILCIYYV